MTLVDLGRRSKAGAQRVVREFLLTLGLGEVAADTDLLFPKIAWSETLSG
jgi:hypothetical protein